MCIRDRGTITQAIASYGRSKGLEIRTNAEVIGIDTAGSRAVSYTHLTLPTSDLV